MDLSGAPSLRSTTEMFKEPIVKEGRGCGAGADRMKQMVDSSELMGWRGYELSTC